MFRYVEHGITFQDNKLSKLTHLLQDLVNAVQRRYLDYLGTFDSDDEYVELLN